jgi:glycosyltransferase involved in cell wall biosynthesis
VTPETVLVVTPRWIRDGGVATHAIASAALLARAGITVHALCERADPAESHPGVTVHVSTDLLDSDRAPAIRLGDALAGRPELTHMHQLDDPQLVAALRESAPVVISMHGYSACTSGVHYFRPGHECTRAHGVGCIPNLLARGCAHTRDPRHLPASFKRSTRAVEALRAADLAIAYSSAIDRHLATNGVEPRAIVPLFTTVDAQTGSGHAHRRRVVFAGRLVAMKGVAVLLRAAQTVDAEFVICGDGWQLDALVKLATRLGVRERVNFTGWLSPEALARELAEASVVAMPSLWPEPFGLVGLEALAAGRPVIASATGGIGDWLLDGVNGLAVAPGDHRALARALSELLADPARQQAMGAAGREMVSERFSTEQHLTALLDAYRLARASWESVGAPSPAGAAPTPV